MRRQWREKNNCDEYYDDDCDEGKDGEDDDDDNENGMKMMVRKIVMKTSVMKEMWGEKKMKVVWESTRSDKKDKV